MIFDLGEHLALAGWFAHMRTVVEIGEEFAFQPVPTLSPLNLSFGWISRNVRGGRNLHGK
jgi:hypothetical protein